MPRPNGTHYTNFYLDANGSCKNPGQAIAWLQSDQDSPGYLTNLFLGVPPGGTIHLGNQALLMMGITEELQAALRLDYANGIHAVETAGGGSMRVYYVRRRVWSMPPETKSVVIIASWPTYWQQNGNYFCRNWPPRAGDGWYNLWDANYNNMPLDGLADRVLLAASGVTAWW
jgi:hypothetical protein